MRYSARPGRSIVRPERLYSRDIVEAADSVAAFLVDVDEARFLGDDVLRSAVLHKLTVVGEAAARVATETRALRPEIPWSDVVGFPNIAVHAYFAIDWEIVWATATIDLPALRAAIAAL